MFDECSKSSAEKLINHYISTISKQVYYIEKNYNDMNLDNVDVKQQFRDIANDMERICNHRISMLRNIKFE